MLFDVWFLSLTRTAAGATCIVVVVDNSASDIDAARSDVVRVGTRQLAAHSAAAGADVEPQCAGAAHVVVDQSSPTELLLNLCVLICKAWISSLLQSILSAAV